VNELATCRNAFSNQFEPRRIGIGTGVLNALYADVRLTDRPCHASMGMPMPVWSTSLARFVLQRGNPATHAFRRRRRAATELRRLAKRQHGFLALQANALAPATPSLSKRRSCAEGESLPSVPSTSSRFPAPRSPTPPLRRARHTIIAKEAKAKHPPGRVRPLCGPPPPRRADQGQRSDNVGANFWIHLRSWQGSTPG